MDRDPQPTVPAEIRLSPDTVLTLRFVTERKTRRRRILGTSTEQPGPPGSATGRRRPYSLALAPPPSAPTEGR